MNLIDLGIKSVLAGTLGWIAVSAFRRSSASTRHMLLFLAIGGVCLLPIVSALLPAWHVPFFTVSEHTASTPAVITSSVSALPSAGPAPLESPARFGVAEILAALWAACAAMLGIRLAIRLLRLNRTERVFDMNTDPRLQELVSTQCRLSGRHVLLLQGPAGEPPMTWGHARPVLVLPEDAHEWPDDRLTSVVMHELAHIERSDWVISLFAEIACAINWFNPFVWVMKRQMEIESETAADDRVLSHGVPAVQYASHLVDVTRQLCLERSSTHVALAMARPGKLDARIRAILEAQRCRRNLRGSATLVVAATFTGIVALLATAAPTVVRLSSGGAVPKLSSDFLVKHTADKTAKPLGDHAGDTSEEMSGDLEMGDPSFLSGDVESGTGSVVAARTNRPKRPSPAMAKSKPAAGPKPPTPAIHAPASISISGDDPDIHLDLSEFAEEMKKAGAELDASKAETYQEIQKANREVQESLAKAHITDKKFIEGITAITHASTQMAMKSVQGITKAQMEAAAKALKSLPKNLKSTQKTSHP